MHKCAVAAGLLVLAFSSTAFAQEPPPAPPPPPPPMGTQPAPAPAPPPPPVQPDQPGRPDPVAPQAPPSPGRSPMTPEAPTVAPASDPAHASPSTAPGPSVTEPPRAAPQQYPAVGAHLGFAVPIVTVSDNTTAIGADFVNVGLTPGLTVHLDDKWALDFEFIAFNHFKDHAATTFIVDPGIIRKFDGFNAGLRVATEVGAAPNSGIVPIFILPIKVSQRSVYFVEVDVPLFLRERTSITNATLSNGAVVGPFTSHKAVFSGTLLLQTGFGF